MSSTSSMPGEAGRPARFSLRRLLPLAALAFAIGAVLIFDLDRHLTFDALRENRAWLATFVAEHRVLASIAYVLIYAAVVAMSLPGAAVLTIAGGFLFGTIIGVGTASPRPVWS